jgi:hypothetical protein
MPTVHSTSPTQAIHDNHPYAHGAESQSPPASSHPFAVKQRGVYEQLLAQNPGVARQGEGWASRNNVNLLSAPHPSFGKSMGKTSSMMSLREKAKAFLNVGEKAQEKDKRETLDLTTFAPEDDNYHPDRGSRRESKGNNMVRWSESTTNLQTAAQAQAQTTRPGTPGALSTLSMSTNTITAAPKKKGLFKNFKWGKKEDA